MVNRRGFMAAWFAPRQPLNFVVILVDDWGGTDASCYGSKFYRTPNIDKLAGEGMRFTQAYSACTVCSPSRAALLTGKYPARLHITDWIAGHKRPWAKMAVPDWRMYLPLEEKTIAEALKPLGYATAHIGKWHLTPPGGDPGYLPNQQGFDVNLGGTHRGQPPSYFAPYGLETLKDGPKGEYLTDREQAEASAFIRGHRDQPFFVYLPHYTVHTPLQAPAEKIATYKDIAKEAAPQHNPIYAAMIESLDDNIGRLMKTLEEAGVADRTVVMLTGDNGGLISSTNTNLGMRAGKGSAYEGGVRVPLMVRWPGVTRAGSVSTTPVIGCDVYPTVLEMAGLNQEAVDGESLVGLLKGGKLKRDDLYWHYPHYHPGGATPYSAVRHRDWKLIEFHEDGRAELYNLSKDPEEKVDVSASSPRIQRELLAKLKAWRERVGAQMPTKNPNYDPAKEMRLAPGG